RSAASGARVMYGGRGISPYFARVPCASRVPTNLIRRNPPPSTSRISAAASSPKVTRRPGFSLPPGCPIASGAVAQVLDQEDLGFSARVPFSVQPGGNDPGRIEDDHV